MDATSSICRRLVDSHASINGLSETIIKPSTEQMGNIASTCQEVKANKPALNVTVKPLSGGHERADKEKLQTIDLTSLQTSFDVSKTVPQVDKSTKAQMPKAQMSKAQAPKVKVPKVQVPTVPVSKPQVLKIQVPKVQAPQPQVTKAQVSKIQVAKQPQVPKVQVPEPQVPIARDSTLTTRIKSCSTKKLAAQLGHYINLLGNHSARKKVPIDFKFCASKSSEIYTVILLYNGLSFTSKSPSKRLAKRLAAKQACEHFQIS